MTVKELSAKHRTSTCTLESGLRSLKIVVFYSEIQDGAQNIYLIHDEGE